MGNPLIGGILDQSTASDLVDLSIQNKWVKAPEIPDAENFRKFCNVITGNPDETYKDTSISGAGRFQKQGNGSDGENAIYPKDKPIQGNDKSITMSEFSAQIEITKRMWIFGLKKNGIENIVQDYKKRARVRRETDCENFFDNFDATTYVSEEGLTINIAGGNSVALGSASQTREDSGTNNGNIITDGTTTNMDLDYDALKAMHRTAKRIKGLRGEEYNVSIDTVWVPKDEAIHFRAIEIKNAKGIPASMNNDAKAIKDFTILPLAYISNTAYWGGIDTSLVNGMHGIQYIETQDITLSEQMRDDDNGAFKYNVTAIYETGFNDYRPYNFSDGTNS